MEDKTIDTDIIESEAPAADSEPQVPVSLVSSPNPEDPIAAAMARSADGKVAVIERGSGKARIISGETNGGNGAGETAQSLPPQVEPISMDEADANTIRESFQQLRGTEANISQLRVQYLEREQELLKQRKDAQADLQSTIKTVGKRNKVPQDWVLNIETMCFEPQKRQSFPFARR